MKKKLVVALISAAMVTSMLGACGSGNTSSSSASSTATSSVSASSASEEDTTAASSSVSASSASEEVSADADQEAADKVAALIDQIYVQERNDNTDEQCKEAKEAWDALTDAQKELVEGENADPDYFGRDTGDASKDDPLNEDEIGENELLVVSFGTSFNNSRAEDIGGIEKALQAAYLKQRSKISLPGFRKGKVPRQMIEKMYGPEVFYDEAANHMISEAYGKAYDECELEIASQPTIDVVQLEKGKDFIFTAEVAVKPEVKLGEYKGLKVDKVSTRVMQKEVDEEIEKERERNARTVEVTDRAVQDKDIVTLDFEGFVDGVAFEGGKGENYPLTIGSGAFIPGFEEQLVGAKVGDDVDVKVTFPEEYQAKELAGKEAVFKCTVHEIKAKELPELDDEFASEVSEEAETLEDYKAEVKAKIKERKENEGKEKKENQAVEQAVANAEIDLPAPMVDLQAKQMADDFARRIMQQGMSVEQYFQFTGLNEEKMMEELKPQAEKRIRTRLVLEAIVAAENIEVSDERLDEELQKMADSYQMKVEKLKEFMGENEKKQMKEDIAVQDAVTLITEAAVEE